MAQRVLHMYERELVLKTATLDSIQTAEQRNTVPYQQTMVVYLSAWVMQPYLEVDRIKMVMNLFETELRKGGADADAESTPG